MQSFTTAAFCGALLALFAASPALAQRTGPPVAPTPQRADADERSPRFRLGPLGLSPRIELSDVGVDTNVFNETEDPKRDFTTTVSPSADYTLRMGRARLRGTSALDLTYFKEYQEQRSLSTSQFGRFDVVLNRLRPYVAGTYVNSRQRPGFEIDARARRLDRSATVGADLRVGGRTTLGASAQRGRIDYQDEPVFGVDLANALNREIEAVTGTIRLDLTPLTTLVLVGDAQRDRFDKSPVRDADSYRGAAGFEFSPFALLKGQVLLGYRRFETLSPDVRDFDGLVLSANLAYVLRASTRFQALLDRDTVYSPEESEPYLIMTGLTGQVTQRIFGRWDAQARWGRHLLDYQGIAIDGIFDSTSDRRDTAYLAGAGIGYRVRDEVRLGVDANHYRRRSTRDSLRAFEGWRIGASLTYGL